MTSNQAGEYRITFTVVDELGASASAEVLLVIAAANRPPVLQPIPPQTVKRGETLQVQVHATDPDGDALKFRRSADRMIVGRLEISSAGLFTWQVPRSGVDHGSRHPYKILIRVDDGWGGTASTEMSITVM